jgi:predicted CopG family antitoxin
MRTTIEISDDRWAFLKLLAVRRGEKGFSHVIEEAIDLLAAQAEGEARAERKRRALAALGSISVERGDEMQKHVRELREGWRDRG